MTFAINTPSSKVLSYWTRRSKLLRTLSCATQHLAAIISLTLLIRWLIHMGGLSPWSRERRCRHARCSFYFILADDNTASFERLLQLRNRIYNNESNILLNLERYNRIFALLTRIGQNELCFPVLLLPYNTSALLGSDDMESYCAFGG